VKTVKIWRIIITRGWDIFLETHCKSVDYRNWTFVQKCWFIRCSPLYFLTNFIVLCCRLHACILWTIYYNIVTEKLNKFIKFMQIILKCQKRKKHLYYSKSYVVVVCKSYHDDCITVYTITPVLCCFQLERVKFNTLQNWNPVTICKKLVSVNYLSKVNPVIKDGAYVGAIEWLWLA